MIVPDVNLLLYAFNSGSPHYNAARRWWEGLVNDTEQVGLPWAVIISFIRLATHPRMLTPPMTTAQAIGYVRDWLDYNHIVPINPGAAHLMLAQRILDAAGAGGDLVPDAHIAALAMEYGAEVHSNDADFSRFPGLQWRNPLAVP